ncbi:hypothetical protein B0H10DRAFT_1941974 [Mycena sp. CBHHK59/15]|nr:hypothetical protein B0H10DRAFT_1941974 [Mycena sp. CBHHK59/15]
MRACLKPRKGCPEGYLLGRRRVPCVDKDRRCVVWGGQEWARPFRHRVKVPVHAHASAPPAEATARQAPPPAVRGQNSSIPTVEKIKRALPAFRRPQPALPAHVGKMAPSVHSHLPLLAGEAAHSIAHPAPAPFEKNCCHIAYERKVNPPRASIIGVPYDLSPQFPAARQRRRGGSVSNPPPRSLSSATSQHGGHRAHCHEDTMSPCRSTAYPTGAGNPPPHSTIRPILHCTHHCERHHRSDIAGTRRPTMPTIAAPQRPHYREAGRMRAAAAGPLSASRTSVPRRTASTSHATRQPANARYIHHAHLLSHPERRCDEVQERQCGEAPAAPFCSTPPRLHRAPPLSARTASIPHLTFARSISVLSSHTASPVKDRATPHTAGGEHATSSSPYRVASPSHCPRHSLPAHAWVMSKTSMSFRRKDGSRASAESERRMLSIEGASGWRNVSDERGRRRSGRGGWGNRRTWADVQHRLLRDRLDESVAPAEGRIERAFSGEVTSRGVIQRWRGGSGSLPQPGGIRKGAEQIRWRIEIKRCPRMKENGNTSVPHAESSSKTCAGDEDEACIVAVGGHSGAPEAAAGERTVKDAYREAQDTPENGDHAPNTDPTLAKGCGRSRKGAALQCNVRKGEKSEAKRTHLREYTAPKERGCSVGHNETSRRLDTQEDEMGSPSPMVLAQDAANDDSC